MVPDTLDTTVPTALLVIDMQEGFAARDVALRRLAVDIAEHVYAHVDDYVLLAASRFRNVPGSLYHRLISQDMTTDAELRLLPELASIPFDIVVDTCSYSSLTDELLGRLRAAGVERLVVVGADTDQCVLATVLAAFDAGIEPIVRIDLCRSAAGADPHEAGLIALRRAIGEERVIDRDAQLTHS
ncbi:MAG: isochorismatase hydrolase [Thermoleophilia bacterium]|nr:isochorismatase hydrolase [Thermoleophilia bacterium]MCZ4497247.1 isochorismatase hydrolase [Thermoleophilia bacterium]